MDLLKKVSIQEAMNLAQRFLELGDFSKTTSILEQVLATRPSFVMARVTLGVAALKAGESSKASRELKRALTLQPSTASTWGMIALATANHPKESSKFYRRTLSIDPTNLEALLNLGLSSARHGDKEGETSLYRRAFLLSPDDRAVSARTARACYVTGSAKRAILPLSIARVLGGLLPLDVLNLVDCFNRTQALPKAEKIVTSLLETSPIFAPAWSERMEVYRRAGKLEDALSTGRRAQICQPDDKQTLKRFGRLLMSMSNQPYLLATGRRGSVLDPSSTFAKVMLRHHATRALRDTFGEIEPCRLEDREAMLINREMEINTPTLRHIANRLKDTIFHDAPFEHGYVEKLIPEDIYARLTSSIPNLGDVTWGLNEYPDRANVLTPRDAGVWSDLAEDLSSSEFRDLLIDALGARPLANRILDEGFELTSSFRLTLDRANYALGPHRDHVSRFIVCLIYLASPGDPEELGTSIYRPLAPIKFDDHAAHHFFSGFERLGTFDYKPNACLCFVNRGPAYHGVEPVRGSTTRRLIQYTIYMSQSGTTDDPYA
jgi:tetratricopeptide (TPR) repeat protein